MIWTIFFNHLYYNLKEISRRSPVRFKESIKYIKSRFSCNTSHENEEYHHQKELVFLIQKQLKNCLVPTKKIEKNRRKYCQYYIEYFFMRRIDAFQEYYLQKELWLLIQIQLKYCHVPKKKFLVCLKKNKSVAIKASDL